MKRMLTGLALASAATVIAAGPAQAAPAQAAPKNPVAAVQKQLVPGTGMKWTERTTLTSNNVRNIFVRRSGTVQFSKTGVAASDTTGKLNLTASDFPEDAPEALVAMTKPEHTIKVGNTSYLSGNIWATMLPEGKTWFKMSRGPVGGLTGLYGQPVNIGEPATLKTLLKGAKPAAGGYAGKITFSDLNRVSPSFHSSMAFISTTAKQLKTEISWRLDVDAKGLPTRLVATYPMSALAGSSAKGTTLSVDTRYSGWGAKVEIKAPSADEVTTELKDGNDEAPDSIELPFGVSVAK
ncbi:hypothetical protein ABZ297_33995 [Nonomuraea sp. NPDC005983]|uniref:hypothetical protein n=1 Tax=Nonomuraea sp. NPDC005983 TaxID=3155595 RepID=UPI0033B827E3